MNRSHAPFNARRTGSALPFLLLALALSVASCGGSGDTADAAIGPDVADDGAPPDPGIPDADAVDAGRDAVFPDAADAPDPDAADTPDLAEPPDAPPAEVPDVADDDAADAPTPDAVPDLPAADPGVDWGPIVRPTDLEATGFYRTHRGDDGRWWLVTPDGAPFYSVGICSCQPNGSEERTTGTRPYRETVLAKYGDNAAWAQATGDRLESWGFNTLGAWSDANLLGDRMAYTVILYITGSDWLEGNIPDYFSPEFEARCRDVASKQVAPRKDDPNLLGWFLDNELRWGPDWRSQKTLLADYLALPVEAPGRIEAEKWVGDPQGFLRVLADRYFQVTTTAVREADPNHLILGVRAVSVLTPEPVVEAAGAWLDVFSANNYVFVEGMAAALQDGFGPLIDSSGFLQRYAEVADLPILITEFSFRAADSGLPNGYPPIYPVLDTQQDRADAFEAYADDCYRHPWIVGHHWFEWVDQPAGGRFDGEDNNFGLVDIHDDPWQVLVDRMTAVHARAPHRPQP